MKEHVVEVPEYKATNINNQNGLTQILLIIAVFAAGYFWGKDVGRNVANGSQSTAATTAAQAQDTKTAAKKVDLSTIKGLFTKSNMTFGNVNSKLLFVEVSDPSCPYCHIAAGVNKELAANAGNFKYDTDGGSYVPPVREMKKLVDSGKAAMVVIYSNGHGNGEVAQQALYCAYDKNKYWEAHELLYSDAGYKLINDTVKNDITKAPQLVSFLSGVVDSAYMTDCINSGKYKDRITKDQTLARNLGVQGTPGFFVNTTNFAGAYGFTDMKSAVDEALK